ncbi:unnamed protein product [Mytilus edulis]|uniref:B box-type domain-containing protein n=1 Tax=Mytilus edulis TaxID=6550 RepID=A0A8S3S6N8_MYTED|nr:unnamed protein product [Mytilus edulis]
MSTEILCGPCGYEDNIKNAKKWCTDCEEGLSKIKDVAISQTCIGHGKRYDLYCSEHDKPLCIDCVDQHKSCSQLVSLDNAATNAKQSTALADLQDTINGAIQNVGRCIKTQERINKEFDQQESLIKKNIQETREKLNQHLDLWEQKLMQNLSTKTAVCKSTYGKILNQLHLADKKLSQLKEELETMKQMASDIQVFLGTREFNKTVSEEIQSIRGMIKSTKYFEIKMETDSSITSLLDCVNRLGILSVEIKNSELEFKGVKLDQAQKQIYAPTGSSNGIVDVQLKQRIRFKATPLWEWYVVSGCLILPNGNYLLADFTVETIVEYSGQGQYVRDITCSGKPYYLTLIDPDRFAVTCFKNNTVEIMNISNAHVQKITTSNECCGIAYEDGKLFVVEKNKGYESNNLSIIKINGQERNVLLMRTDGLMKPRALCYNKDRQELLVCNENDASAAMYKVIIG